MIPQEKSAAVTRGLREAFGVSDFEDIHRMTKGRTSALVFRIVVRGTPFLLRIIMRTDLMLGPERHFACMRAAAEAGLAPRVWYASLEDQLSITDFVEEVPFATAAALVEMPKALRTLHALSPFPGVVDYLNTSCMFILNRGTALDAFLRNFEAANILSKDECRQLFEWRAQAASIYKVLDSEMVSSHNDLFKPDNILFDGKRVWLVDWEAAFLNDRYADLAAIANMIITNMIVTNDEEERIFLQGYFGQPPDEYQLARLFLMRQVARMFYAIVFLGPRAQERPGELDLADFHRRYWAGEINLVDDETKSLFGWFNWTQLLQNMRHARFSDSLKIVSDRKAR